MNERFSCHGNEDVHVTLTGMQQEMQTEVYLHNMHSELRDKGGKERNQTLEEQRGISGSHYMLIFNSKYFIDPNGKLKRKKPVAHTKCLFKEL